MINPFAKSWALNSCARGSNELPKCAFACGWMFCQVKLPDALRKMANMSIIVERALEAALPLMAQRNVSQSYSLLLFASGHHERTHPWPLAGAPMLSGTGGATE